MLWSRICFNLRFHVSLPYTIRTAAVSTYVFLLAASDLHVGLILVLICFQLCHSVIRNSYLFYPLFLKGMHARENSGQYLRILPCFFHLDYYHQPIISYVLVRYTLISMIISYLYISFYCRRHCTD